MWAAGYPAAWGVTSSESHETITFLLRGLKGKIHAMMPEWRPSCFVVDCCDALITALRYLHSSWSLCGHAANKPHLNHREVFPGVPIRLCNYHVQTAWQKNLMEKVAGQDLRMSMFKALRAIQALQVPQCKGSATEVKQVMDRLVAERLAAFEREYGDVAPAFIKYLKKEWVDSCKMGMVAVVCHDC
jgi:hypothetical protein